MKKYVLLFLCYCIFLQTAVFAKPSYTTQLNKGAKLLNEQKFTPAIESYTKAVRLAPENLQSRAGLANAYITRANVYYNKDKEFGKAANDYRSALYYIQCFKPVIEDEALEKLSSEAENKLNICYKKLHLKKNCESRFFIAELLEIAGVYPAAVYEYSQASKDNELAEKCNKNINELIKEMNRSKQ